MRRSQRVAAMPQKDYLDESETESDNSSDGDLSSESDDGSKSSKKSSSQGEKRRDKTQNQKKKKSCSKKKKGGRSGDGKASASGGESESEESDDSSGNSRKMTTKKKSSKKSSSKRGGRKKLSEKEAQKIVNDTYERASQMKKKGIKFYEEIERIRKDLGSFTCLKRDALENLTEDELKDTMKANLKASVTGPIVALVSNFNIGLLVLSIIRSDKYNIKHQNKAMAFLGITNEADVSRACQFVKIIEKYEAHMFLIACETGWCELCNSMKILKGAFENLDYTAAW